MSIGKMRIKLGPIEIEYEGSEEFLKKELPELLSAVSKLHKESGLPANPTVDAQGTDAHPAGGGSPSPIGMSVTSIAAKLNAKSGPELAIAAAARLTRGGAATFTRQQLLVEMKKATGFFKATFRSNLSNTLLTLVKEGKLHEVSTDTYSLGIAAKNEVEKKLAG